MCPYIRTNYFTLLKALHRGYLSYEGSNNDEWLAPLAQTARVAIPTVSHASHNEVVNPRGCESRLQSLAKACRQRTHKHLCLTETFTAPEEEVALALLSLENALEAPRLAQKILLQGSHAPSSQTYYSLERPEGRYTFWASVGYHEGSTNLEGETTYGIRTTVGFSFQSERCKPLPTNPARTRALNPKKATKTLRTLQPA